MINPYVFFTGECEKAFTEYAEVLGGKIEAMMPHEGTPAAEGVPPSWAKKILHARMSLPGGTVLMASDAPPERQEKPQGFMVNITVKTPAEAERIYAALSAGAREVQMPLGETFWAQRFAMFVDKYGIPWMINCEKGR